MDKRNINKIQFYMNKKTRNILNVLSILFFIHSCEMQENKNSKILKSTTIESELSQEKPLVTSMSNPIMMNGANIGCLFNAYFRTGQTHRMVELLDAKTKQNYTPTELYDLLQKLDYGYDMILSGMKEEGSYKILNYTCIIQQTKVIKQLKVKIENDTARICPKNLEQGIIFQ
jgi:hypothetical protein